jgi:hypothetical protein
VRKSHHFENYVIAHLDLGASDPFVDKGSGNFCLELLHVGLAKQKLTIEVGRIDGVHINNMDILEARKS